MNKSKNEKGFSLIEVLLILVVVAVLASVTAYVYFNQNRSKTTTLGNASTQKNSTNPNQTKPPFQLPSGWVLYTNSQAGFKLAHPQNWGDPQYSAELGTAGTDYTLNFWPGPRYIDKSFPDPGAVSRNIITVRFSSDDFSSPGEKGGMLGPVTTKADIEKSLASIGRVPQSGSGNTTTVYKDSQSYTALLDNINPGETNILTAYSLVSLPKLNVSAAIIDYEILDRPANCSVSALSSNDKQWCETYAISDDLLKVLDSLSSV